MKDAVEKLIQDFRGTVGVAFKNLKTGEDWAIRGDEVFPAASVIKVAVMVEAFAQVEEGKLRLSDSITLTDADKVPGAGVLQFLDAGLKLTLRDALALMIMLSDNTATNLVLDKIGLPATARRMEMLHFPHTKIHSKVFRRETSIFPERSQKYGLGSTTPNEMARLLEMIANGVCVSKEASRQMLDILKRCEDDTMIKRFLPPPVTVAHKTGAVDASRLDAGIVYSPKADYILCVFTTNNADKSWRIDNEAQVLIANISRAVYEHI
ncbi:MAG: class A beta-lactamase-related serine hydrolase [Abditibacteriales bacterium]|nr:class A beta-lactamase-related serine hydrolase [Abditibacteriales bacterium]MDW8367681.1 serine hydrolase [Abditibacteriales bacterium]